MSGWVEVGIGVCSFLFLLTSYAIGTLVRNTRRQTRYEDKIETLEKKVIDLVTTQQQMQASMLDQMKYDRDATDRRLRYVEEYFMHRGMG